MALRQVQVDDGVLELHMPEQKLDRAQIGAGFQQVSGVAVAEQVRRHTLLDAGILRGLLAGVQTTLSVIGASARQPFS